MACRVAAGCYRSFLVWQCESGALAADPPGYLGSGALAPSAGGDEFQVIFRSAGDTTPVAWAHSASRQIWPERGQRLFDEPREHRAHGLAAWFDDNRKPLCWKQSAAIWLAFFPVSLAFNLGAGLYLDELSLAVRTLLSMLVLTPLMTYWFIPLSSRLLAPWLHRRPQRVASLPEVHWRFAAHLDGVGRSARLYLTGLVGYPASIRFPLPAVRAPWRQPRS